MLHPLSVRPRDHALAYEPSNPNGSSTEAHTISRPRGPRVYRVRPNRPVRKRSPRSKLRLHLAGTAADRPEPAIGQPIQGPSDPRWVLAIRAAEQLQGALLTPDRRDKLVRLGRVLGLRPFDANLVIAIVQDQARRGYRPEDCPAAGERQLRMVSIPATKSSRHTAAFIALTTAAVLCSELLLMAWLITG